MKKSELRQIIKEEIRTLNEGIQGNPIKGSSVDQWSKAIVNSGKVKSGDSNDKLIKAIYAYVNGTLKKSTRWFWDTDQVKFKYNMIDGIKHHLKDE